MTTFAISSIRISHNLRRLQNDSKGGKCIVQKLLVDFWVKISDKQVGADIQVLLVRRSFVHSNC